LGEEANISINRVNDIPALRSGKRPYVINEYLKETLLGPAPKWDTARSPQSCCRFISAFYFQLAAFAFEVRSPWSSVFGL
jgi:hypothetical protein